MRDFEKKWSAEDTSKPVGADTKHKSFEFNSSVLSELGALIQSTGQTLGATIDITNLSLAGDNLTVSADTATTPRVFVGQWIDVRGANESIFNGIHVITEIYITGFKYVLPYEVFSQPTESPSGYRYHASQLTSSVAEHISTGNLYKEAVGSAPDVYVLERVAPTDAMKFPIELTDGMIFTWIVSNTSTGTTENITIQLPNQSAKTLINIGDFASFANDKLVQGAYVKCLYDSGLGQFKLLSKENGYKQLPRPGVAKALHYNASTPAGYYESGTANVWNQYYFNTLINGDSIPGLAILDHVGPPDYKGLTLPPGSYFVWAKLGFITDGTDANHWMKIVQRAATTYSVYKYDIGVVSFADVPVSMSTHIDVDSSSTYPHLTFEMMSNGDFNWGQNPFGAGEEMTFVECLIYRFDDFN
jgi:hypothetical protein